MFLTILRHPVLTLKAALHPIFLKMMPSMRDFELKFIKEKPETKGPVLYLATHTNIHDAPIAVETIKEHFYVLRAKQELSLINQFFFAMNGNIVVDRDSRKSGAKAIKKIIWLLQNGKSVLMFPEGTWGIHPSKPINHCHWGWVEIARKTHATVLPIVFEYYECTDNLCYINFGEPFQVEDDIDNDNLSLQKKKDWMKEKNDFLEETFTTLKFEIWQQFPVQKRCNMARNFWNGVLTWRYYELGQNLSLKERKYIIGNEDDPEYVLESLHFNN